MRAAASGMVRARPVAPSLPYLGVTGTFQLEEQLGDLAEGTGRAQAVPKRAAQGSDQQVALHGLQGLGGKENPRGYTQTPPSEGLCAPGEAATPPAAPPAALP